jgi:2-methylcitrate dehydratase PrpD
MLHPFIDCARRLALDGVDPDGIETVLCGVGEGTVHRLWEPLAEKQMPSTSYSAKFSGPFAVALGLIEQAAGLEQFTEAKVRDPALLGLAATVRYDIDPQNEYPRNYTGDVRLVLADGTVREAHQPYLRGGVREPLERAEITAKFRADAAYGGWPETGIRRLEAWCERLFEQDDLSDLSRVGIPD